MSVLALEGWVENGLVRLEGSTELREKQKVFVVVPGVPASQIKGSLVKLVDPGQASEFELEVATLEADLSAAAMTSRAAAASAERKKQLEELLSHQGQIDLELDQAALRRLREGP